MPASIAPVPSVAQAPSAFLLSDPLVPPSPAPVPSFSVAPSAPVLSVALALPDLLLSDPFVPQSFAPVPPVALFPPAVPCSDLLVPPAFFNGPSAFLVPLALVSLHPRCHQCHRCHSAALRCRCHACGDLHFAGLPCSHLSSPACVVCGMHHVSGPCVAGFGPVVVTCSQCGRVHLPSRRCRCRLCGMLHTVATGCGARASASAVVFPGVARSGHRHHPTEFSCGPLSDACMHCGALFFSGESGSLRCCQRGTIAVAETFVPAELFSLITDSHVHVNIRKYNTAFQLASVGYSGPSRPYVDNWGSLKISGRTFHVIGDLIPVPGNAPQWGQIYILDSADATCQRGSATACAAELRPAVMSQLHSLLLQHNQWVREFRLAAHEGAAQMSWSSRDISMRAGMVAVHAHSGPRDVILRRQDHQLLRISCDHALYFPLSYILLFPAGGVGFSDAMTRTDPHTGHVVDKLSMAEWARFLMMRKPQASLIHLCGKLSLEFWCDVWSTIECKSLDYVASANVQSQMRSSRYRTLIDQLHVDGSSSLHHVGVPILMPPSFVGSPRWYQSLYLDALALPAAFHRPDLFITVTFNPDWPVNGAHMQVVELKRHSVVCRLLYGPFAGTLHAIPRIGSARLRSRSRSRSSNLILHPLH